MKDWLFRYNLYRYNKHRYNKDYVCLAPFSSLFLDYKGNAYACFANKHMLLGNYFEHSLHEIWKSEAANKLRQNISSLELRLGCQVCRNKIASGQFTQVYARHYDSNEIGLNDYPTVLELQLTNRCNLKCLMCVVTKDEQAKVDIQNVRENIREIIPFLKRASFSGGEPFLIDEYYDIWQDFIELNPSCRISVNTNGTILDDRVKYFLNNLRFNISVSVDGLNQKTFETIRVNANKEQVYDNLLFFKDYCQTHGTSFNVKTCAIKQNIDEIPELIKYFDSYDISVILNEVVYPLNTALWNYRPTKLKLILEKLIEKEKRIRYFNYSNTQVLKGLIELIEKYYKDATKLEHYIRHNYSLEQIKWDAQKRLSVFFENQSELQHFVSIIEEYSPSKEVLKTLYLFFLIAPFERMIGELEVRNKSELKNIFDNVLKNFEW